MKPYTELARALMRLFVCDCEPTYLLPFISVVDWTLVQSFARPSALDLQIPLVSLSPSNMDITTSCQLPASLRHMLVVHSLQSKYHQKISYQSYQMRYFTLRDWAINGHLPAKYLLSRCVHEAGFKVVLTGEGADEVFLGYPHFKLDSGIVALEDVNASNPEAVGVMLPAGVELSTESVAAKLGLVPAFIACKSSHRLSVASIVEQIFQKQI